MLWVRHPWLSTLLHWLLNKSQWLNMCNKLLQQFFRCIWWNHQCLVGSLPLYQKQHTCHLNQSRRQRRRMQSCNHQCRHQTIWRHYCQRHPKHRLNPSSTAASAHLSPSTCQKHRIPAATMDMRPWCTFKLVSKQPWLLNRPRLPPLPLARLVHSSSLRLRSSQRVITQRLAVLSQKPLLRPNEETAWPAGSLNRRCTFVLGSGVLLKLIPYTLDWKVSSHFFSCDCELEGVATSRWRLTLEPFVNQLFVVMQVFSGAAFPETQVSGHCS